MTFDECFAILERCAANGERCPVNHPEGSFPSALTSKLAYHGKIRIEVMRGNWRVVTILVGPHAGKETAAPPGGRSAPYLVIDSSGARRHGRPVDLGTEHRRIMPKPTLRKFSWDRP